MYCRVRRVPVVHRVPPSAADDYDAADGGTPAYTELTRACTLVYARQKGHPLAIVGTVYNRTRDSRVAAPRDRSVLLSGAVIVIHFLWNIQYSIKNDCITKGSQKTLQLQVFDYQTLMLHVLANSQVSLKDHGIRE